jgi:DNA-binding CsgD family transcriptional regulator
MGRPDAALDRLRRLAPGEDAFHPPVLLAATGDVVEAAVRSGQTALGAAVLGASPLGLERWAELTGEAWAHAACARSRALLAGSAAEPRFEEAVRWHASATRPFERARTELLYGEWLRRARRPREARTRLRTALDTFERLAATPWEVRARSELAATGETRRSRPARARPELTPREVQIARLVRAGATNREIAAQLFLSPRTIDYHVHKILTTLGVRSRIDLARLSLDHDEDGPNREDGGC